MENNSLARRPDDESQLVRDASALLARFSTSSIIERSQRAFRSALPGLLATHDRKWVAFHGDVLVGLADHEIDLYEECARQGLSSDQFVVRCIMPEAPEQIDAMSLLAS